ncbi:MAG: saccharopine dehydrogenase [Gammaproteobacteria bacterium]|nr:MAG: saccharopine dehydrogenase [Gammaproteobacteria bacterium]
MSRSTVGKKPVVVYGASGYTAQLICEYLRNFDIPFIAAGRSHAKVAAALSRVPGIETAAYDIEEVEHETDTLAALFDGAKVVCNTVGPFTELGSPVVEAALKAGCHYLDTTGEQPFIRRLRDEYGAAFAARGLLLAPSTASMWGELDILIDLCTRHGAIDSIEASMVAVGVPTYGSTQTVFQGFLTEAYYLDAGRLTPWPACQLYEFSPPSGGLNQLLHHWGGGALPIYYEHHPEVRTVRVYGGFTTRELMDGVQRMERHYQEHLKDLPIEQRKAALSQFAASMQGSMPPRENPLLHRTLTSVIARGTFKEIVASGRGAGGYTTTAAFQAAAARLLLTQGPRRTGFQSPTGAFGSEYLRNTLDRLGLWRVLEVRELGGRACA